MNRSKFVFKSAAVAVGLFIAGTASAQYGYGGYGYGNPSTGAGSQLQPSMQYQQMQQDAQRRANTYYYQPAPSRPITPPQTQYMYPDSSLRSMGFAPVPTQLSPQAANAIGIYVEQKAPVCAKGAVWGAGAAFSRSGPGGVLPGAAVGCFGNMVTN